MNEGKPHGSERGEILLELAAATPLLILLCVAIGTSFLFGVRAYALALSDWSLQEQVGYAMERMTADLRYAEAAKAEGGKLKVFCREASGEPHWVEYERTNEAQPRIRRDSQPLTGQSTLGAIGMKTFEADVNGKTVFLRLIGENQWTGQTYELETAITCAGKGTS